MSLHFQHLRTDASQQPLVVLHGVFGSSDNWITVGRRLSERYEVFLLDLNNHGRSYHHDALSYAVMADDVRRFVDQQNLENVALLGHSMGGKVAMQLALTQPEALSHLIVVDIAPRAYPVHHDRILEGLRAIPLDTITQRNAAEAVLRDYVPEAPVRQFLLKNLYRNDSGQFAWRFNLSVLHRDVAQIGRAIPDDTVAEATPYKGPALFIKGAQSDYVRPDDEADIARWFLNSRVEAVADAGHWVHAEQPEALLALVTDFVG